MTEIVPLSVSKGFVMLRQAQHDTSCHPACPVSCGELVEGDKRKSEPKFTFFNELQRYVE